MLGPSYLRRIIQKSVPRGFGYRFGVGDLGFPSEGLGGMALEEPTVPAYE